MPTDGGHETLIKPFFLRRCAAYICDLILFSLAFAIIVVTINNIVPTRIIAPSLISSNYCQTGIRLYTQERMNELLPLKDGYSHQQTICQHNHMLFSRFYTTTLEREGSDGWAQYNTAITFYSDAQGQPVILIPSDPFQYLLAPLIFALFLTYQGKTPGKRIMRLTVYDDNFDRPDLKSALKREYLKAIILVIIAVIELGEVAFTTSTDIDQLADLAQLLSDSLTQTVFWLVLILSFLLSIAALWFWFGSFINWRGRTYWDQFAKLNTNLTDEFNSSRSSSD